MKRNHLIAKNRVIQNRRTFSTPVFFITLVGISLSSCQKATDQFSQSPLSDEKTYSEDEINSLAKSSSEQIVVHSTNRNGETSQRILNVALNSKAKNSVKLTKEELVAQLKLQYGRLSAALPKPTEYKSLPIEVDSDSSKIKKSIKDLRRVMIGQISESFKPEFNSTPLPDVTHKLEHECKDEIGAGVGSDITHNDSPYETDSLVRSVDFPLKRHLTCIRDQGRRGTGVEFGIAATLETMIHKRTGKFVNLSEQYLTFVMETNQPRGNRRLEGVSFDDYESIWNLKHYYRPSYEDSWYYNPANYRIVDNDRDPRLGCEFLGDYQSFDFYLSDDGTIHHVDSCELYKDVCLGYSVQSEKIDEFINGQACSSTAHEGIVIKKNSTTNSYRLYAPFSEAPYTFIGVRDYDTVSNWYDDWNNTDGSQGYDVIEYLEKGIPVLATLSVDNQFMNTKDGYVYWDSHQADYSEPYGSTAVELIGWVPGDKIPHSAPKYDSTYGYFIAKNSFGEKFGDNGFVYISYEYFIHTWDNWAILDIEAK